MLKEFQEHIDANFSYLKESKLLVAISGGVDSVVLTCLLAELGFSLELAHCNFTLRKQDADLDEQFVVDMANRLGLKIHTKRFDTSTYATANKISIQMAARDLRYHWFETLLKKHKLDYLLTAHHLDDSLETFLINLTRGTGLEGLTGIAAVNGTLLRPLLPFTRDQIEGYARQQELEWREDLSNQDTKYVRNKIRHSITPILKEMNPGFMESFRQTLGHIKQSQAMIDETVAAIKSEIIEQAQDGSFLISIEKLKSFNDPAPYLYEVLSPFNFTDWKAVGDLLVAQPGKYLLSSTHRLVRDRTSLILEPIQPSIEDASFLIKAPDTVLKTAFFSIEISSEVEFGAPTKNVIYVDADRLIFPLEVRKRRSGDVFYPFGLGGKKKLSKFFKDEKFSLIEKETTWLLCSNDQIVAVLGHRMDARFKLTEKTQKILRIAFSK